MSLGVSESGINVCVCVCVFQEPDQVIGGDGTGSVNWALPPPPAEDSGKPAGEPVRFGWFMGVTVGHTHTHTHTHTL